MDLSGINSEMGDSAAGVWPTSLRQYAMYWCEVVGENGYWAMAMLVIILAFSVAITLYVRIESGRSKLKPLFFHYAFVVFASLILFVMRWPTLIHTDLNTDEHFLVAGARTLSKNWNYFSFIDGMTSGPLNFYTLASLALFGLRIDIVSARVLSLVLTMVVLVGTYGAAVSLGSAPVALLTTLVIAVFFGAMSHQGWVHYSSEYVSLALISLIVCILASIISKKRASHRQTILFAVIAAALPFAKLQALPFSILFFAWFSALLFFYIDSPKRLAMRIVIAVSVGVAIALPFILALGLLPVPQSVRNFGAEYIEFSVLYVSVISRSFTHRLSAFWNLATRYDEVRHMLMLAFFSCCAYVAYFLYLRERCTRQAKWLMAFIATFIFTGVVATMTPGRDFSHYLLFTLQPCLIGVVLLAANAEATRRVVHRKWVLPIIALSLSVAIVAPIFFLGHPSFAAYRAIPTIHQSAAARLIASCKQDGDELTVWGWCTELHAQADIRMGTKDIQSERVILPSGMRDYYRARTIRDFKERTPEFFVDSVGKNPCAMNFLYRDQFGHETFPELKELISQNYQFLSDQEHLRVYISYERFVTIIEPEYLYPLILYLDMTATGSLAYDKFGILFHALLEAERAKLFAKKSVKVNLYDLYRTLGDRALDHLVDSQTISKELGASLRERAIAVIDTLMFRYPNTMDKRKPLKLKDPIRIYRRLANDSPLKP